ncbi:hypothetical protein BX659_12223 [Orenia metallireducens]|uniref:Uncharacterized protein n=1 Tax=Orenia metallireducens TaxID=1413210 RepID=A0A285GWW0_9FIRM|nr:hypothetical protein [Orenia metallireducens]PRX25261.1 hypothetical protein BX659_12223 [Orenia metallireducens]SNY27026.1 hypothetical protein SAMN06265827_11091 [Orenia metallireducens]
MGFFSWAKKIKSKIASLFKRECHCRNKDVTKLNLDGLEIFLERCFAYDKPHEVTIIVPRAELRKKIKKGEDMEEIEILLNSITVVSSPQRPPHEGEDDQDQLPKPPEIPRRSINSNE